MEEEKRALIDRKRNILCLILQYLEDYGFYQASALLKTEASLPEGYQVCDNIDLDSIYLDYCSYYHLKFGKSPRIVKRNTNAEQDTKEVKRKSSANARKKSSVQVLHKRKESVQFDETSRKGREKIQEGNDLNTSLVVSSFSTELLLNNCNSMGDATTVKRSDIQYKPLRDFQHYSPEWQEIATNVCRDLIKKNLGVDWTNVHGMQAVRTVLNEGIIIPMHYPNLFAGLTKPWKSLLLHGPPGTGKTLVAKAICTETCDTVTFFNVCSSTMMSKWRGESEKYIRVLFELARFYSPSIIFIDEIEGLASRRDSPGEHEASKRFKNELLTLIDGLDEEKSNVFLLGSTNLPWEIDPAFLRRFERKIMIELPDSNARHEMIKTHISIAKRWNADVLNNLVNIAEGLTGDDIRIACKEAIMKHIRAAYNKKDKIELKQISAVSLLPEVQVEDLYNAFQQLKPVTKEVVEKHRHWNAKYGTTIDQD